jgi:hypothetical protein
VALRLLGNFAVENIEMGYQGTEEKVRNIVNGKGTKESRLAELLKYLGPDPNYYDTRDAMELFFQLIGKKYGHIR